MIFRLFLNNSLIVYQTRPLATFCRAVQVSHAARRASAQPGSYDKSPLRIIFRCIYFINARDRISVYFQTKTTLSEISNYGVVHQ